MGNFLYITGGVRNPKALITLRNDFNTGYLVEVKRSRMRYIRRNHAVCTMKGRYLILSGGERSEKKAERFDTLTGNYTELPNLTKGRYLHASCSVSGSVYVFAGHVSLFERTGSIEKLDLSSTISGDSSFAHRW